jgi:hypothetical protein
VHAGAAERGFSAVLLDGAALAVGASAGQAEDEFSVDWLSRHQMRVSTADFTLELESSDQFVNIVSFTARRPLSSISAHGLLGQTASGRVHKSTLRYIEGEVDDYVLNTHSLFATDFTFNRFQQSSRAL